MTSPREPAAPISEQEPAHPWLTHAELCAVAFEHAPNCLCVPCRMRRELLSLRARVPDPVAEAAEGFHQAALDGRFFNPRSEDFPVRHRKMWDAWWKWSACRAAREAAKGGDATSTLTKDRSSPTPTSEPAPRAASLSKEATGLDPLHAAQPCSDHLHDMAVRAMEAYIRAAYRAARRPSEAGEAASSSLMVKIHYALDEGDNCRATELISDLIDARIRHAQEGGP